jgi:hypothetical protein
MICKNCSKTIEQKHVAGLGTEWMAEDKTVFCGTAKYGKGLTTYPHEPAEPAAAACPLGKCDGSGVLYYNGDGLASPSGSVECLCRKPVAAAPQICKHCDRSRSHHTIAGRCFMGRTTYEGGIYVRRMAETSFEPPAPAVPDCIPEAGSTRTEPPFKCRHGNVLEVIPSCHDCQREMIAVEPSTQGSEPDNERLKELAERLVAPGSFPNMSASEGHELYEGIRDLLEAAQPQPVPRAPAIAQWSMRLAAAVMNSGDYRDRSERTRVAYIIEQQLHEFVKTFFTAIPAQKEEK